MPDGVSIEQACMVVDMMTTGFYGSELAEVKFGDTVVVFGIGPVGLMAVAGAQLSGAGSESLNNAVSVARFGYGNIAMLDVITGEANTTISNMYILGFLAHKTIRGGLCPSGRKRMERLLEMVKYGRVDTSNLITHRFKGLESIEPAFQLMVNKPKDLIKPIILFD